MKKADKGREEITDTERKELELLTEDKEFNQRLSKLEKEYQEIKIPDELKGRVIQAMQEARNDAKAEPDASDKKMEEDPRMNRIRRRQSIICSGQHRPQRQLCSSSRSWLIQMPRQLTLWGKSR